MTHINNLDEWMDAMDRWASMLALNGKDPVDYPLTYVVTERESDLEMIRR